MAPRGTGSSSPVRRGLAATGHGRRSKPRAAGRGWGGGCAAASAAVDAAPGPPQTAPRHRKRRCSCGALQSCSEDALRGGQHLKIAHALVRNLLRQGTPVSGGASIAVSGCVPEAVAFADS